MHSNFDRIVMWSLINDMTRLRKDKSLETPMRRWISTLGYLAKHAVIPVTVNDSLLIAFKHAVNVVNCYRDDPIVTASTRSGIHPLLDLFPAPKDNGVDRHSRLSLLKGDELKGAMILEELRCLTGLYNGGTATKSIEFDKRIAALFAIVNTCTVFESNDVPRWIISFIEGTQQHSLTLTPMI